MQKGIDQRDSIAPQKLSTPKYLLWVCYFILSTEEGLPLFD